MKKLLFGLMSFCLLTGSVFAFETTFHIDIDKINITAKGDDLINGLDKLIAGSIMLLVPGLALTNSIRDLLEGQLVSGLTRAAEAFFIGLSAALGTGYILHLYLKLGGF